MKRYYVRKLLSLDGIDENFITKYIFKNKNYVSGKPAIVIGVIPPE